MGCCCENLEEQRILQENQTKNAMRKLRSKKEVDPNAPVDPLSDKGLWLEVEEAFTKYDTDGNGSLSPEECEEFIKIWCQKRGMEAEEANIVTTFDDIDENGDGEISKQELFNFIKD